jgi:hypothetical protein
MNDEERVWWENPDSTTGLPPNPFQFGHTIALAIDASGGDAYALVSLFSTVNFAVQLGHVKSQSDSTVVVHIDPHAERPPSDIQDIRRNSIIFNIQKPLNSTDNLNDMISTGRAQQDLQLLVARITKWNAERATRPIFDELISIRNLGHDERKLRIKAIIDTQGQRVLNLLGHFIEGLKQQLGSNRTNARLRVYLDQFLIDDPRSDNRLRHKDLHALELAKAQLANEIEKGLISGELEFERLLLLLGGGPGAAIAGKTMIDHFCSVRERSICLTRSLSQYSGFMDGHNWHLGGSNL